MGKRKRKRRTSASYARRGQKVLAASDTRRKISKKESKSGKRLNNKQRKTIYNTSDEWNMSMPFKSYLNIGKATKWISSWGLKRKK